MRRWMLVLALAPPTLAGCELQEVTLAPPEDVVVVEAYLRTNRPTQFAFIHRTIRGREAVQVPAAEVVVTGPDGRVRTLQPVPIEVCFDGPTGAGTCYAAGRIGDPFVVEPGARYALEVRLPDGRRIEGETRVPGDFRVTSPVTVPCAMPEGSLDITWTVADGAWAYLVDAELHGLKDALASEGIVIEDEPFLLSGVTISEEDTTLSFPAELGVFERFGLPRDLVLALQAGLPDGVESRIFISAADRNFVNWARRGNFNPSGLVRVSSLRGDGIGVFGSLVVRDLVVGAKSDPLPVCSGG